jgi:hypothetical protein
MACLPLAGFPVPRRKPGTSQGIDPICMSIRPGKRTKGPRPRQSRSRDLPTQPATPKLAPRPNQTRRNYAPSPFSYPLRTRCTGTLGRNLTPRDPGQQARLAVALVAEGEIERFAEHPGLGTRVPFGPGVAGDGNTAATLACIFNPRSIAFCHARHDTRSAIRFGGNPIHYGGGSPGRCGAVRAGLACAPPTKGAIHA